MRVISDPASDDGITSWVVVAWVGVVAWGDITTRTSSDGSVKRSCGASWAPDDDDWEGWEGNVDDEGSADDEGNEGNEDSGACSL